MLRFEPLLSTPKLGFWEKLSKNKLNKYKLDDKLINITGYIDSSTLTLDKNSFNDNIHRNSIEGYIKIVNTLEEFKTLDKKNLLNKLASKIWNSITNNVLTFNTFIMLIYADLKHNKFIYWTAYPTFKSKPIPILNIDENIPKKISLIEQQTFSNIFTIIDLNTLQKLPLSTNNLKKTNILIVVLNLTTKIDHPTWLLRNFLCYLQYIGISHTKLLFINENNDTCFKTIKLHKIDEMPKITGWEKNEGKMKPKVINLNFQNKENNNINLRLMRWRMLPKLNIDLLSSTKCLLIGAGTLGCAVSRSLISWGINHITFVDNGLVSRSNPVRQSLYLNKDIGKTKAHTAAERLNEILPSINSQGYKFCVPMPGHIINNYQETQKNIELLDKLVIEHDVVFILTDTRESRWLPILLGKIHNKQIINVALGFDSFLIIRSGSDLGCYFCNDVIAPRNSTTKQTLDQQCTVTRPAVANIASSLSVELLVALLQENRKDILVDTFDKNINSSKLGLIPHQIRGDISNYRYFLPHSEPFIHCTACSDIIINYYKKEGIEFLLKVFNNPDFLEEVSGLSEFHKRTEDIDIENF